MIYFRSTDFVIMKNSLLVLFSFVLFCRKAVGDDDINIKKGTFPFMAFVYYDDPTVENIVGERVARSAVLIREDWLVTSSIANTNDQDGFPKKTLVARLGAINIDGNFTLNEDEDEQEREVIQIVRPFNHSATQWWTTDISLLKTLFPFNITKAVNFKMINEKRTFSEKTCIILFYAKLHEGSDDRTLSQSFVEVLDTSIENCGTHIAADSMVCASDRGDENNATQNEQFCHGNSGGPLICEGEVMGIQTYIENNCEEPHLYQLLSAWDNFIVCGIEEKCFEEQCSHICDVTNKDPIENLPPITPTLSLLHTSTLSLTTATLEKVTPEGEIETTSSPRTPSVTPGTLSHPTTTTTKHTKEQTSEESTVRETEETTTHDTSLDFTTSATSTTTMIEKKITLVPSEAPWPKVTEEVKLKAVENLNTDDRESPEAQHMLMKKKLKKKKSAANRHLLSVPTLVFGLVLGVY